MSSTTSIEWTATVNPDGTVTPGRTWNPVRGCSVISAGCHNCYAMKMAHRFSGDGKPYAGLTKQTKAGPQWTGKVVTVESALIEPLSWRTPKRVFVNSMSDLFHEGVPIDFVDRVFAVMALCPQHTFQILTKRADRMRQYVESRGPRRQKHSIGYWAHQFHPKRFAPTGEMAIDWPLPNVWLGVSVENQKYADERIPMLLETPAAVRFVSAEPLLGPIDFTLRGHRIPDWDEDWRYNVLSGEEWAGPRDDNPERSQHLDWVIVGGESGGSARPFDIAWARSIVQQCADAGVAAFVKQLGADPYYETFPGEHDEQASMNLLDRKGGDITEWPPDLRVREFPSTVRA